MTLVLIPYILMTLIAAVISWRAPFSGIIACAAILTMGAFMAALAPAAAPVVVIPFVLAVVMMAVTRGLYLKKI